MVTHTVFCFDIVQCRCSWLFVLLFTTLLIMLLDDSDILVRDLCILPSMKCFLGINILMYGKFICVG
jgi:hypothetical protein